MIINSYTCPVCGNKDINSIGILNGKQYCRRCISFKGEEVENKRSYPKKAPIFLDYELSIEQESLSDDLLDNYKKGIDTLVYAVTGSGKTEISLQLIQYAINCGEKVAFALPRRDVCIELYNRLKDIFKENSVVCVYGGHTFHLEGDIVVLTTHQLYRYKRYFSLIILDEIDAFPFRNNIELNAMFYEALCGHYVMMSATPPAETIKYFSKPGRDILSLQTRFHRHPLPTPTIFLARRPILLIQLCKQLNEFIKKKKPVFVFAPTIEECEMLYHYLNLIIPSGNYVHSKREHRKEIISAFRKGAFTYLVTTSVLERGVTVSNLQVIVYHADHDLYDSGVLVQISGRVGRKIDAPDGEVIYLASKKTKAMEDSIKSIKESNKALQDMLSRDQ